jgi:hypothetical protein
VNLLYPPLSSSDSALSVSPAALGLSLVPVAPQIDQQVAPAAIGLTLSPVAPAVDQQVQPAAIGLTLGQPAPTVEQAVAPAALSLALGTPAPAVIAGQQVSPGALGLTLTPVAPTVSIAGQPVLRGTVGSDVAGTAFTIDVTSTVVGKGLVIVAAHDATGIAVPTLSGGGPSSYTFLGQNQAASNPRNVWWFEAVGSYDGTDITVTFSSSTDGCRAALVDMGVDGSFVHFEGRGGSLPAPSTHFIRHQHLGQPENTLITAIAIGRSAGQSSTHDTGVTELYDVDPGSVIAFAVGYKVGGLADFKHDWTFQEDAPHGVPGCIEFVPTGNDDGSTATRIGYAPSNSGSGLSADTISHAPQSGRVFGLGIITQRTASSADPTSVQFDPTGTPVSFTKVAAVNIDADRRLHLYAHRFTSTPTPAVIRATFAAVQSGYAFYPFEILNPQGSTDTDWAGTPVTNTGTGTTASATLGSVGSNGAVLAIFGKDATVQDWTTEEGFVPIGQDFDQDGHGAGGTATASIFGTWNGTDDDLTPSATIGTSSDWAVITVETLGSGGAQTVSPAALGLSLSPVAPSIAQSLAPAAQALTLSTVSPAVAQSVMPPVIGLSVAPVAPVISQAGGPQAVEPAALALSLAPQAPIIAQQVQMGALALSLGLVSPQVQQSVSPAAIGVSLGLVAPALQQAGVVSPPAIALVLAAIAPSITGGGQVVLNAELGRLIQKWSLGVPERKWTLGRLSTKQLLEVP